MKFFNNNRSNLILFISGSNLEGVSLEFNISVLNLFYLMFDLSCKFDQNVGF